jgi:uncharacterized protein with GYD domain
MPKYLIQASYTVEGLKGLLKEGGSSRREAVRKATESLGGTLEAFYYAFGSTDAFVIIDHPDNVSVAAVSMVVNVAGTAKCTTTVLITPEEVDQATEVAKEMSSAYRPPGQ